MTRLLALTAALIVTAPGFAADEELAFLAGAKAVRLRLSVDVGGKPDEAWTAFLNKLFAHFDRDGDGVLSPAEAKRVFPLPLPGGGERAIDFAALDANRDGKASREEFFAYYRECGFTPVTVIVRPAPAESFALGEALFRHLDHDGDGLLSAEELRRAPALLNRLDDDDDEVLTARELLGASGVAAKPKPAGLKLAPPDKLMPAPTLRLTLGGQAALAGESDAFRLSADGANLRVPGGICSISAAKDDPAAGFRTAKGFYLAQFQATAGDKPAAKTLFEDDPTAQVLAGLFDAADRDGDGKLTRAELEAFFDLIELGVGCRVVVTATDRGRNLFDLFDANGDGRLDLDELTRAGRNLPGELARDKPLKRDEVPSSYRLTASRGPVGDSFGPVPFGASAKPKPPAPPVARGPAWFRAMDKNGDGFVSAREFVGPPDLFVKLDANGDGRISVEEAEARKP